MLYLYNLQCFKGFFYFNTKIIEGKIKKKYYITDCFINTTSKILILVDFKLTVMINERITKQDLQSNHYSK